MYQNADQRRSRLLRGVLTHETDSADRLANEYDGVMALKTAIREHRTTKL